MCFFFFFFSRCIFWQNNFLRASVGVNGTFIYYPRQLQFLGGQGSSAVVQRGNKSSCNSGHAMSLLWPHREGEDLRTLATSVHEGFSSYQCASQPGVWTFRKMFTLTQLTPWVCRGVKLCLRHTDNFRNGLWRKASVYLTSVSLSLGRTNGFHGVLLQ